MGVTKRKPARKPSQRRQTATEFNEAMRGRTIDLVLHNAVEAMLARPEPPRSGPPWTDAETLAWRLEVAARALLEVASKFRRLDILARPTTRR